MTNRGRQFERFRWLVWVSPLVVALILAALWVAGTPPPVPDLRLSAATAAQSGATVALRAWQVDQDDHGYTIISAPAVEVELRNAAGLTLASTHLRKSLVQGMEGELTVPAGPERELSLVASAEVEGREVVVRRKLHVHESWREPVHSGREVNAFQTYELGPLRIADRQLAPAALDPRVEGGACVPEIRCWLSVWVGDRPARVRIRPLTGVRLTTPRAGPSRGFLRFPLVVIGNEARVQVEALGEDDTVVASREVRLPVVPGGMSARALVDDSREGRVRVEWKQLGDAKPVLVDIFRAGRWIYAASLSPDNPWIPTTLAPGVWRLQIRADLFSDNTAGVAYVVIVDPDGPGRAQQAANAILAEAGREGLDPLAMAITEDRILPGEVDDALRALFAVPSFDVISLGPGMSSRVRVHEKLQGQQELRRWVAAAVIMLIGLIVSMILLRLEAVAQARARWLLEDLDDEGSPPEHRSVRGRGLWAFVLLVFVLMAVLALSKRWF